MAFKAKVEVLPPAQRTFWRERSGIPGHFVLYGGTAIALRLGHRISEDFDFFSVEPFLPGQLLSLFPFAKEAEVLQSQPHTLTLRIDRGGPVKLSFFGGLTFGQIAVPDAVHLQSFKVASPDDLMAAKLKVVWQRAEAKDYIDIAAIIRSGLSLERGLGCAVALYGEKFNPAVVLKALTYFEDGDLRELPAPDRQCLIEAVRSVRDIPKVSLGSGRIGETSLA